MSRIINNIEKVCNSYLQVANTTEEVTAAAAAAMESAATTLKQMRSSEALTKVVLVFSGGHSAQPSGSEQVQAAPSGSVCKSSASSGSAGLRVPQHHRGESASSERVSCAVRVRAAVDGARVRLAARAPLRPPAPPRVLTQRRRRDSPDPASRRATAAPPPRRIALLLLACCSSFDKLLLPTKGSQNFIAKLIEKNFEKARPSQIKRFPDLKKEVVLNSTGWILFRGSENSYRKTKFLRRLLVVHLSGSQSAGCHSTFSPNLLD